jgi:hypothetical protein
MGLLQACVFGLRLLQNGNIGVAERKTAPSGSTRLKALLEQLADDEQLVR